jgi:hypothetical protein
MQAMCRGMVGVCMATRPSILGYGQIRQAWPSREGVIVPFGDFEAIGPPELGVQRVRKRPEHIRVVAELELFDKSTAGNGMFLGVCMLPQAGGIYHPDELGVVRCLLAICKALDEGPFCMTQFSSRNLTCRRRGHTFVRAKHLAAYELLERLVALDVKSEGFHEAQLGLFRAVRLQHEHATEMTHRRFNLQFSSRCGLS